MAETYHAILIISPKEIDPSRLPDGPGVKVISLTNILVDWRTGRNVVASQQLPLLNNTADLTETAKLKSSVIGCGTDVIAAITDLFRQLFSFFI